MTMLTTDQHSVLTDPEPRRTAGLRPRASRRTRRSRDALVPLAFLAPTFVGMALFFLWPLAQTFWLSLQEKATGVFTFDNYLRAVGDPRFAASLGVSVVYTVLVVTGSLVLGMAVAMLLNRPIRGRAVLRALYVLPWAMPFVSAALVWRWMLDPQYGVVTFLVEALGGEVSASPFNSPFALLTVSVIEIWKNFPLAAIMLLAGRQNIGQELYEAASLDGAGAWSRFVHVTLPGLRGTLVALTLLLVLWTFGRAFMVIFLTTGGGPAGATETLVLRTYQTGFQLFDLPQASALGIVVMLIAALLTVFYLKVARDD
ncbi:carbohydrate ABC transporter permease [Microbacterium sp. Root180]|uniref:carbohydrate ABC transporter permease n=1 Tax=Microbacterium sp. Root180 TaxID=1736483 RepID=UPI0006F8E522|nr:sugar ABC transporter permease [Microbacterium sp. Root180]KRB36627.1 hypothetical protein ASD93_11275 [Microbacterium sp. Root180]